MYSNNDWRYYAVDEPLQHHGIMGQKWGVRRFQNSDGSLTSAGKKRYGSREGSVGNKIRNQINDNVVNRRKLYGDVANRVGKWDRDLADHSITRLGRHVRNVRATNEENFGEYFNKKSDELNLMNNKALTVAGRWFIEGTVFDKTLRNTPYTRLSGRETTWGKDFIENVLSLGTVGLVKDAGYLIDKYGKKNEQ